MTEKTPYQQDDPKATLASMLRALADELDQPATVLVPSTTWLSIDWAGPGSPQRVKLNMSLNPSNLAFLIAAGGQG